MRAHFLAGFLILIGVSGACGQSAPAFDVVSIKPSPQGLPGVNAGMRTDATHFIALWLPIRTLIMGAYDMEFWKISGAPDWTMADGYDITATMPPGLPKAQIEAMLQTLLADRCKLVVHRETKDTAIYALVAAKGGSKLKPSPEGQFGIRRGRGHLELRHVSMKTFTRYLGDATEGGEMDRPVVDMTGIEGLYDITLDWTPDNGPRGVDGGPSILTAVQEQWGLKLEPRKAPVEFIVIDHIERPSEN